MTKEQAKGPSLSALAALATLAITLWMEVDLASALFRSVLVYLGFSMLIMAYRIVLGRFVASSQERAERELLEKVQREAEEEEAKHRQQAEKAKKGVSPRMQNETNGRADTALNKKAQNGKEPKVGASTAEKGDKKESEKAASPSVH
ncbi:hypothetical protein CEE37_00795 [candidate division LCP-89 bacterium B3_LCP]|uniref:Uncharacterized protein n=1 Tax=candidate division LCP-89 bacterium B3_LCP TaxID=2012998 RepID=A0A532V5J6_UNCL8|nr:MAG: hypothetical protein CEE37_00795 [candidate division LCP-89 bacterium B3_LCP]